MANSEAILGMGIKYYIEDGTTVSGTPLDTALDLMGEVYDVSPPNQQTDEVEVTHYGSEGGYREFIGGLSDGGEVTFSINWVPANATDVILRTLHGSRAVRYQSIEFPNEARINFYGWVKGFEKGTPMDDKMTATVTVRVTGPSTYTDPT